MIIIMTNKIALELDMQRNVISGSPEELRDAIRRGADLRVYTEFRHNEHIDFSSSNNEMVRETSDFPATYLVEDRWVAAMMTLRQPVSLPDRFGPRPSLSFFMYNEDGRQAIARPYLDRHGEVPNSRLGYEEYIDGGIDMSKYHTLSENDTDTLAPSSNFIYDFYNYKFIVDDSWTEIMSLDAYGNVLSGNAKALGEASRKGWDLKVAIKDVCKSLHGMEDLPEHEMFIQTGPHYYYTESGFMVAETRPFLRVQPAIPMTYASHNWDFGWAIVRSDGHLAGLYYDPYTLRYKRTYTRHAMRWFTR